MEFSPTKETPWQSFELTNDLISITAQLKLDYLLSKLVDSIRIRARTIGRHCPCVVTCYGTCVSSGCWDNWVTFSIDGIGSLSHRFIFTERFSDCLADPNLKLIDSSKLCQIELNFKGF